MKFRELKEVLLGGLITVVEDLYDHNGVLIGSNVPIRKTILDNNMLDSYLDYNVGAVLANDDCIVVNLYKKLNYVKNNTYTMFYCGLCGAPVSQEDYLNTGGLCYNCYDECCTEWCNY